MSSENDAGSRSTSLLSLQDSEYVFDRDLTPEQNLWAAVVHRAKLDARGVRMGNEADWRNWPQQSSRRWFRDRRRSDAGSWRWVAEALALPAWMVRRIVSEALAEESVGNRSLDR